MRSTADLSVGSKRPYEFRSVSEEVAVGALLGSWLPAVGSLVFGGLIGFVGTRLGRSLGGWPDLGGSALVWLTCWLLPLWILLPVRPWWRFAVAAAAGALYLTILVWHIGYRDIGELYPWILATLPMAIVLGTFYEPIRLAHGGSTERYDDRGISVAGGVVAYGNRLGIFLTAASVLALLADLLSLGRQRLAAPLAGFLAGGLAALGTSSIVAWRGDVQVAELFFGSAWNIAWACTALGAVTGAVSGWRAVLIHERQHQLHQQLREVDSPDQATASENMTEST
jgi:hypothetical protein